MTIEWTDVTWNPIRGCSRVSDGCRNCYAERQAIRQIGGGYAGLVQRTSHGPAWTGDVRMVPELLDAPLRWRKPRRVFVNSMSDLFHEKVADGDIAQVFEVMAQSHQHTFQILTKRPRRMRDWFSQQGPGDWPLWLHRRPLPNVWLGVSVEDQDTADERIPLLLQTPAAVRFVSYEPALGPVDVTLLAREPSEADCAMVRLDRVRACWTNPLTGLRGMLMHDGRVLEAREDAGPRLDWVIVGGESGPGARPCDVAWIRSTVEQCRAAGVPCFVKQLGARPVTYHCAARDRCTHPDCGPVALDLLDRKGGDPAEWPADLRVREMPTCGEEAR